MNKIKKRKSLHPKDTALGVLLHIFTGVCGFFLSHTPLFGRIAPFGLAFVGGMKRTYLSAATAGVLFGYLTGYTAGGFTYIAALFSLLAIQLVLGNTSFSKHPLFHSLVTFLVVAVTKLAVVSTYGGSILLSLGEASIAGTAAYFIWIAYSVSASLQSGMDLRETVSLLFLCSLLLLSLTPITWLGISLGHILSIVIILAAARYGQASYGAVCGTIISFITAISNGESIYISVVFAFAGLFCGLFSGFGSLGIVGSYLGATLISCILLGEQKNLLLFFFEALIGCGFFLLIPKKWGGYFGGLLAPPTEISRLDSVKGALIMRLEFASGALQDIYETVEDVSNRLEKINHPDFEKSLTKIEGEVCGGCSLRKHCWETAKEITTADALRTWNNANKKIKSETPDEEGFHCLRAARFEEAVNTHLTNYNSRREAERRLKEVRGVISDQFEGISNMLRDLSEEFKYEVRHDAVAAENICLSLKNLGFHAVHTIAARDKFDRLSADIHIKGAADHTINKMEIMRHLSVATGRELDSPTISIGGDEAFLFITERPNYQVEIGLSQIPEQAGKLCGDSCKYFRDGRGRLILLLSDGMGTGGRAAVDSAMVSGLMSRMLRSGFGYDCSLKIINSSMVFKSTDESLSTVDIAAIDLFNGSCEMLKAGAAPTYVRRNGKVGKAESRSLPPGILRNISFDKAKIDLRAEDIIVLVSDGVTIEGDDWICDILREWTLGTAQQLADEIAFAARRRRNDGHSDDISVLVGILKRQ